MSTCRAGRSASRTNMKLEPAGMPDDPDVRMSQSIMDYIFRRLALGFVRRVAGGLRVAWSDESVGSRSHVHEERRVMPLVLPRPGSVPVRLVTWRLRVWGAGACDGAGEVQGASWVRW